MDKNYWKVFIVLIVAILIGASCQISKPDQASFDIVIIGGGASGVMAGIQAARMGKRTLIVEETPWLGGMLTSAGVSAIDGNYDLSSGLWEEFRQQLIRHYGSAEALKTGWVSNVLFEPQVGATILKRMATETTNLEVRFNTVLTDLTENSSGWDLIIQDSIQASPIKTSILIDATELGDVLKMAGISYDIGMDARSSTAESIAPEKPNDVIQDLTYVLILTENDASEDHTIPKPTGYDPAWFHCTCNHDCDTTQTDKALWACDQMMTYGKLPNNKIMINWPIKGNDYYVNMIEMSAQERQDAIQKAKHFSLCYLYYLQDELGYRHLSIARDVFPTEDHLPMLPYHRESRRMRGMVRFTLNDLAAPFEQEDALYRTGIAVGDYPVDHHHYAYPDYQNLPDLHFYPVPSYALPLGTLIPKEKRYFIVAEKSVSVTNLVNGTTRLQPVCMLLGQATGALAALAVEQNVSPEEVSVRAVQKELLKSKAYILPYADVKVDDLAWSAVQRVGATGLIKGEGKNVGWRNYTFFYPDTLLTGTEIRSGLESILGTGAYDLPDGPIQLDEATRLIEWLARSFPHKGNVGKITPKKRAELFVRYGMGQYSDQDFITRKAFAVMVDHFTGIFEIEVDHFGRFQK